MKTLAIIPARGGSKRIPRKNIKDFLGKPIISYSINSALDCGIFDEVMVSTDDIEIAEIAEHYGASVPFYRSPEMSNDMAMTAPVLIEVLDKYKQLGKEFEYVACIYPTAPFITPKILKESMELLIKSNVDSVLPIVRYSYPPQRGLIIENGLVKMLYPENYNVRSQDFTPYYHDCGQFYCLKTSALRQEQKLYCKSTIPIELPETAVQDIDNKEDWKIAEMKYRIMYNV